MLGLKFTVYTNNNPLAYVQTSKLGTSHIHWLSKLALFDYNIIHRSGRTNKATDALCQHPEPNCKLESDSDSDDPVMLSYATLCNIIKLVLGDTKNPFYTKKEAQAISNSSEGRVMDLSSMQYLTYSSDQCSLSFQSCAISHYGQSPQPKILCWDCSFHSYIRG